MDFTDAEKDRVRRFWSSPRIAPDKGLKAVDMFDAVHDGRVKAIWIMATNPAVSMPDASFVREALAKCPLVIVSEAMAETDTTAFAHVKLPALTWGERDGTVTNSERRISRQRPMFAAPGEAKPDWAIVSMVAREMGFGDAFDWRDSSDVFREYARLTVFENHGSRLLDLGPWAASRKAAYDAMRPVQWPVTQDGGTKRLFTDGRFQTPDGRARMVPVLPKPPAEATSGGFPFSLNTGRLRDHWHTMTRTGLAPDLCQHAPEPYVDVHPEDGVALGLREGELARILTPYGEAAAVARLTDRQRRGELFMPMHFSAAFAPAGRSNQLIGRHRDPASGQPEFKHTPARLSPWRETWRGFFIGREGRTLDGDLVWRRIPKDGCELLEFAGRGDEAEREKVERALTQAGRGEALVYADPATGAVRKAWIEGGRLERLYFATVGGRLPPREWLVGLFAKPALEPQDRIALLAGRPLGPVEDAGAQVCACLRVGAKTIEKAIAAGAKDVEAVGKACGAGTNCGSCRPEIARMLLTGPRRKETLHAA
jgi:assimilatory nitrate reductase catalytic subunit